jgi:hypothetical protein
MRVVEVKRIAAGMGRRGLIAAAVALLLVGWGGVVRADEGGPRPVPELSPGTISGALTLLAGGLLLLRDRLRS